MSDIDKFGIYRILNKINNKIYIGSTGNKFKKRWWDHLSALRCGKHHNIHLQNAFNKYGEASFEFTVLEVVDDINNVFNREEYWIKELNATDRAVGYNSRTIVEGAIKLSEKTKQKMSEVNSYKWTITFPDGHEENINGLEKFCRKHNLQPQNMWKVSKGLRNHCKGYKVRKCSSEKRKRPPKSELYKKEAAKKISDARSLYWFVVFPDGHEEFVPNLKTFCEKHNLSVIMMRSTIKRNTSHKGYRIEEYDAFEGCDERI